ncbi:MAG: Gfo/Idh/MocA family oxidoreductase [Bacteroidetes bacterium]|nr:Gfo/Idh/MocA family oxidoreductase [Bacteroidota bacterium]
MKKEIKIGIIGTKFMGKAHTHAFVDAPLFFDLPLKPVLQVACGVDPKATEQFANRYGWKAWDTSSEKVILRDDVDLIDICTPNHLHMPVAIAAAKAGKHILCEKPMANNADDARRMLDAVEEAGVKHMMVFNYRRVPALAFAKKMIEDGKIGRIFHFNAVYFQDWLVDPQFPYTWRHNKQLAGSGAHGDLNAHIIDLARFLVGEFETVCGAEKTFIKERTIAGTNQTKEVTVDDAVSFMAHFQNGALGSFTATRFATGRKNLQRIEIFGSEGSLSFNLERLNELEYYNRNDAAGEQGFRTILVTEANHPYLNGWWPTGHIIGWEHTFVHLVSDFVTAIAKDTPVYPNFYDGLKCQFVLDAVASSIEKGRWIQIPER